MIIRGLILKSKVFFIIYEFIFTFAEMKTLTIKNHNNKLACDYFGLIAQAPPFPVLESDMIQQFLIKDADGNYPDFVAERITMTRFETNTAPELLAYLSNGEGYVYGEKLAFYLFKKI
ncbi:MAG: hypothetical protein RL637_342 [Pseudomonadota bacterium]